MTMTPRWRKFALVVHVAASVGSIGAVIAFLALAVSGLSDDNPMMTRADYLSMELITWSVIIPLVLASLLTGLLSSIGTTWGLFRYYWVLIKLLITLLVIGVLLLQLQPIGYMAAVAEARLPGENFLALKSSLVAHATGGLLAC